MGLTQNELDRYMKDVLAKQRKRSKEESLARVSASITSALRKGASWNEVREAVAHGRHVFDPTIIERMK